MCFAVVFGGGIALQRVSFAIWFWQLGSCILACICETPPPFIFQKTCTDLVSLQSYGFGVPKPQVNRSKRLIPSLCSRLKSGPGSILVGTSSLKMRFGWPIRNQNKRILQALITKSPQKPKRIGRMSKESSSIRCSRSIEQHPTFPPFQVEERPYLDMSTTTSFSPRKPLFCSKGLLGETKVIIRYDHRERQGIQDIRTRLI